MTNTLIPIPVYYTDSDEPPDLIRCPLCKEQFAVQRVEFSDPPEGAPSPYSFAAGALTTLLIVVGIWALTLWANAHLS